MGQNVVIIRVSDDLLIRSAEMYGHPTSKSWEKSIDIEKENMLDFI